MITAKWRLPVLLLSMMCIGLVQTEQTVSRAQGVAVYAMRTSDFIQSLGVVVHMQWIDGRYADAAVVIANLRYLGIHHIRDETMDPRYPGQENYGALAKAGIKLELLARGWRPLSESLALLHDFTLKHPGAMSAIEGPNEVNYYPVQHENLTGYAAALAMQDDLYASVRADPALRGLPVYDVTNWPAAPGADADFANDHPYPKKDDHPLGRLLQELSEYGAYMQGKDVVITETGYYTMPGGPKPSFPAASGIPSAAFRRAGKGWTTRRRPNSPSTSSVTPSSSTSKRSIFTSCSTPIPTGRT